jgi:hypothetical protein
LVEKLKDEFMIDADMIYDAIKRRSCFNIIHLKTMFKVDIFILKNNPYEIMEFSRRKPELLPDQDTSVNVATPEDIVLNKLLWYQEGGGVSERQWEDAKEMREWIRKNPKKDYIIAFIMDENPFKL